MDKIEYLLCPLSIIVAYIVTVYLDGWANLVRGFFWYQASTNLNKVPDKEKQKIRKGLSLLLLWSIAGFGVPLQFWWTFYDSLNVISRNPSNFLMSIFYAICFYLIAISIFPTDSRQKKIIFSSIKTTPKNSTNIANENSPKKVGFNIIKHVDRVLPVIYSIVFVYLIFTSMYSYTTLTSKFNLEKLWLRLPVFLLIFYQLIKILLFNKRRIDVLDFIIAFLLILTLFVFFFFLD